MSLPALPVDAVLPQLVEALATHGQAVLLASTGAGKTTRVPPALLDAGLAGTGSVVVLEPRRLAARAAARRMAFERGVPLGGQVGYQVRFDNRTCADTRIAVVTAGLFVRRLSDDPLLSGVGAVVFDEFHERHLDSDLALAMVRRVRAEVRPDLALVVMSATLDGDAVAAALGGCPVLRVEGRAHPVEIAWAPHVLEGRLEQQVELGVRDALRRTTGDVLVFLPGVGEIKATARELESLCRQHDLALVELYGDLPPDLQDAALLPGPRRKLVLATNVAETSITIEGVSAVVDTGLARQLRFDADRGLDQLVVEPISRASADQRAGRAGRLGPGVCVRLWTRGEHENRPERQTPELFRADLSGPVLQLMAWGEPDPAALPWLEAPEPSALATASQLLMRLGALSQAGKVTALGQQLARLPVAPRLGRLLLAGQGLGVAWEAACAAALLSERDPFERRGAALYAGSCDVTDRVLALAGSRAGNAGGSELGRPREAAARQIRAVADQLLGMLGKRTASRVAPVDDGRLAQALLAAFPDRVARRREPGGERALMVGGGGVRIDRSSSVRDGELLLCVGLSGAGRGDPRATLVSRLDPDWLDRDLISENDEVSFDRERKLVTARRARRYADLLLKEDPGGRPEPALAAALLAREAAADPERALDLAAPELLQLQARCACLAAWRPELGLPTLDRQAIVALLPELCLGLRSFAELAALPLAERLLTLLQPEQARALARLAPARIEVPSGSQLRLDYEAGRAPALHVAIQELFGLARTPTVAGGAVPVVLHLLAPNRRAHQVTDDLASFWARTYPSVRRELSRRYPRHAWPEDPLSAKPERRPGRRPGGGRPSR